MPTQPTIAVSREALLALPHEVLIALYNVESRRLAGSLPVHLVDETYKPKFIVGLLDFLPRRYQQMAETLSNEMAAMSPLSFGETAEREPTEAEVRREFAPLTKSSPFSLLR